MKKNYIEAITSFIGGVGVLPILMSIFLETPEFGLAIIIGFSLFLLSGTLKGLIIETEGSPGPFVLRESQKQALLSLIGGIGVITILISLFTTSLTFGLGIIIAYGFFLFTGVFGKIIEVEDLRRSEGYGGYGYRTVRKKFEKTKPRRVNIGNPGKCHSCTESIEADDIFCPNCGAEQTNYS